MLVSSTVMVLEREEALQRHGAEGAEHEQRAMGEVDDAERAEDQRQAQRDQRIGRALVEPVQQLEEDGVHRYRPGARRRAHWQTAQPPVAVRRGARAAMQRSGAGLHGAELAAANIGWSGS